MNGQISLLMISVRNKKVNEIPDFQKQSDTKLKLRNAKWAALKHILQLKY